MVSELWKLRDRRRPLATPGRILVAVVLIGALAGLGFAMTFLVGQVTIAAGWRGTPGVFHVEHCQMVTDSSDNGNSAAQCTGLFQPAVRALPANADATLANGQLYPSGATVPVSSDGTDAVIARTAENVRFYLGGVLCVLCFVLIALGVLLPATITGWFFRFPRSLKVALPLAAVPVVSLIVGLALTLAND
jgi:hypothetical protein